MKTVLKVLVLVSFIFPSPCVADHQSPNDSIPTIKIRIIAHGYVAIKHKYAEEPQDCNFPRVYIARFGENDTLPLYDYNFRTRKDTVSFFSIGKIYDETHANLAYNRNELMLNFGEQPVMKGDTILLDSKEIGFLTEVFGGRTLITLAIDTSISFEKYNCTDTFNCFIEITDEFSYSEWRKDSITYHDNGIIKSKCRTVLGDDGRWVKNGKCFEWDESGRIMLMNSYYKDTLKGEYRSWYPNGNPEEAGWFDINCGPYFCTKNGLWRWWNENGKLIAEGEFHNGSGKSFFLNGQQRSEQICIECEMTGAWKEWYPNGRLKFYRGYKNGQRDGIWREWAIDGQKLFDAECKNGWIVGISREWNEAGQIIKCMNNLRPRITDFEKLWFDNGQLKEYRIGKNCSSKRIVFHWDSTGIVRYLRKYNCTIQWDSLRNVLKAKNESIPFDSTTFAGFFESEEHRKQGLRRDEDSLGIFVDWKAENTVKLIKEYYTSDSCFITEYHPVGKKKAHGKYDYSKLKKIGIWKYYNDNGHMIFNMDYDKSPPDTIFIAEN